MEIRLICSTRHFKIESEDFHFNQFTLKTDESKLWELIGYKTFIEKIGLNFCEHLVTNPYYFLVGESDQLINEFTPNELRLSEKKAEELQFFMFCLWFIKDCCSNTDQLYTYIPSKDLAFSRQRTVFFTNASGEYVDNSFTLAELNETKKVFVKFSKLIFETIDYEQSVSEKEDGISKLTLGDSNFINDTSVNRIYRAYLFITLARSNSLLPLKISFYIGALEALFTTDKSEVSHKVTERVCLFLKGTKEEKLSNFQLIKKAYDIRSKFVHGQNLGKKVNRKKLQSISTETDTLLRQLMNVIISKPDIFLGDNEEISKHFTSLLLE